MSLSRRYLLFVSILFAVPFCVSAQQLAHPGWQGNGMSNEPWWKSAVIVEAKLPVSKQQVDTLVGDAVSLSADAILLQNAVIQPQSDSPEDDDSPMNALLRDAGKRSIRILVQDTLSADTASSSGRLRYWYTRGIAGIVFNIPKELASAPQTASQIQTLRKQSDGFTGQRLLIIRSATDFNDAQLAVMPFPSSESAATLTTAMNAVASARHPLLEMGSNDAHGYVAATLLLTHRSAALLPPVNAPAVAGQKNSISDWYRQLVALRHSNATFRSGEEKMLNAGTDSALVWMRKGKVVSREHPAIVVACNLTSQPLVLKLHQAITSAGVRGSFMKAILRTDGQLGGMNLDTVTLPPNGVFIGEVRF